MKIMYLGWPKCASTWLHVQLYNAGFDNFVPTVKENHLWYTDPNQALKRIQSIQNNNIMDFSTNNWSMDSSVAKQAVEYFDILFFIKRNVEEIISSYYTMFDHTTWNQWQNSCLHNGLAMPADVLERWHDFAGEKLKIYDYNELKNNKESFIKKLSDDLKIKIKFDNTVINKTMDKKNKLTNVNLLKLIDQQNTKLQNQIL